MATGVVAGSGCTCTCCCRYCGAAEMTLQKTLTHSAKAIGRNDAITFGKKNKKKLRFFGTLHSAALVCGIENVGREKKKTRTNAIARLVLLVGNAFLYWIVSLISFRILYAAVACLRSANIYFSPSFFGFVSLTLSFALCISPMFVVIIITWVHTKMSHFHLFSDFCRKRKWRFFFIFFFSLHKCHAIYAITEYIVQTNTQGYIVNTVNGFDSLDVSSIFFWFFFRHSFSVWFLFTHRWCITEDAHLMYAT